MTDVRTAAVAGQFYPGDAATLRADVERLLIAAPAASGPRPRALIAPHAGYVYSGAVAAHAYAELAPLRGQVSRVIILGPAHRVPLSGLGTSSADAFGTPLGAVPIDRGTSSTFESLPGVARNDAAHQDEHAIEVQLPFLQMTLGTFSIVPLVVGDADAPTVRNVLESAWNADDTVIVISTDLSHFLDYDTACAADRETDLRIRNLDPDGIGPHQACGCRPLAGALLLARERGSSIRRLAQCNSGDTAGPRDRVVGYAAYAIH